MITLRRHKRNRPRRAWRSVFSKLYDIVVRIGHSETLYHRPGAERGPPEGKNFTTDFRLETERSPARFMKSFWGTSSLIWVRFIGPTGRVLYGTHAKVLRSGVRHASACRRTSAIKERPRISWNAGKRQPVAASSTIWSVTTQIRVTHNLINDSHARWRLCAQE